MKKRIKCQRPRPLAPCEGYAARFARGEIKPASPGLLAALIGLATSGLALPSMRVR